MTMVANEKPREFWVDLICQDQVVPHPENLTWVFRRSHVRNNPLNTRDTLGLYDSNSFIDNWLYNPDSVSDFIDPDYFDWFTPQVANTAERVAQGAAIVGGTVVGISALAGAGTLLYCGLDVLASGSSAYTSFAIGNVLTGAAQTGLGLFGGAQIINQGYQFFTNPNPAYSEGQPLFQQNALTTALDLAGGFVGSSTMDLLNGAASATSDYSDMDQQQESGDPTNQATDTAPASTDNWYWQEIDLNPDGT